MFCRAQRSSKRRAFSAAKNCSAHEYTTPAHEYTTPSTTKVDGVHWEKGEGGCQKKTMSGVQYSLDGSKTAGTAGVETPGVRSAEAEVTAEAGVAEAEAAETPAS